MTKNLDNQPIMTKNLDKDGLKSIVNDYDLLFIDLWGVIHNGEEVYENSLEVLNQLNSINKEYVLLTNAPRPSSNVKIFLEKMGINKEIASRVYSSGEAALEHLLKNKDKYFFHIGPPRDCDLFKSFDRSLKYVLLKNKSSAKPETKPNLFISLCGNSSSGFNEHIDLNLNLDVNSLIKTPVSKS